MALIPVTILTGFLGSGKTTLLKHILTEDHGKKIAVIENEFGEENIDNDILVQDHEENIVQMSNGCICCTIRGDLVEALNALWEQRKEKKIHFDRVVIETTGVANPGPVAQTFFMDDDVADHYVLDAVVTLVDAKHGQQQLSEHEEAQRQVGFADRIFITKTDLVSSSEVEALRQRLMHMNPRAPISAISKGVVPLDAVLDLKGFNLNAKLDIDPHFLEQDDHDHAHCDHDHDHGHGHHHHHDEAIRSFSIIHDRPIEPAAIETALMTVEGELDDISGVGQTKAAHTLTPNIPGARRAHWEQPRVGHYGIFNGRKWREQIMPRVRAFIRENEAR